jgi:hypothetical protein
MNASPIQDSASAERGGPEIPARLVLLCLAFAALGAAIGLFATGTWVWGVITLLLALIALAALGEATNRNADARMRQSRPAADGRAHATTAAEVWRARLDARVSRWRTRSRLDAIAHERGHAFQALGEAVWLGDPAAERQARQRIAELEQEAKQMEDELAARLAGAEERIRRARLPEQDTLMVAPNEPSAPYPPPDEGNPPQPAQVPEPYPPPDEGTPPEPAPDPGEAQSE